MNARTLKRIQKSVSARLRRLNAQIFRLEDRIDRFMIDELDTELYAPLFDVFLNSRPVKILDLEFNRSDILKNLDPTAYETALWEYCQNDLTWIHVTEKQELAQDLEDQHYKLENWIYNLEYLLQCVLDELDDLGEI